MKTTSILFAAAVLHVLLSPCANPQCPEGFKLAGEVTASTGPGQYQEVQVTRELLLPNGIQIDTSYRQKTIRAAGDGAASDMRAEQIPPGLHLIPTGPAGGRWWSIDNPKLVPETVDANKKVVQWKFSIELYANSGNSRPAAGAGRGAQRPTPDVRVSVCVKPVT